MRLRQRGNLQKNRDGCPPTPKGKRTPVAERASDGLSSGHLRNHLLRNLDGMSKLPLVPFAPYSEAWLESLRAGHKSARTLECYARDLGDVAKGNWGHSGRRYGWN
jgi:hypothetical protein